MFCSNCGKSILPEESSCRHCGASYGKERFYGNTYTSAQVRILASKLNDAPVGGKVAYTRTDYFEQQPADDIYSNTSYRPLLRQEDDLTRIEAERAEQEAEEEARLQAEEDMRRAEEEARMRDEAARAQAEAAASDAEPETLDSDDPNTEYDPSAEADDDSFGNAVQEDSEAYSEYAPEYNSEYVPQSDSEYNSDYTSEDESEDAPEDIPEDIIEDAPLPDDLEDAVISDAVLAHMERQRMEEERRANSTLRMAPLMNLTRKFTPPFMQQNASAYDQSEDYAPVDEEAVEQPAETRSVRNPFSTLFGKKNAPAEDVQVEYEQDAQYADEEYEQADSEEAYSEEDSSEEAYAEEVYSEESYADEAYSEEYEAADAQPQDDYAENDFDDAAYADAEYADAEYADAENAAQDGAVEGDEFSAFEDGEFGEAAESKFNFDFNALQERLKLNIDFKTLLKNRIVTIAAAAVLIAAVIIGGVIWLNFITEQRSKIVDVTYETYQQGIEMLTANTSEEYRSEMQSVYISNTSFANTSFAEDMQAFDALMPASPMKNDELFVTTLTIIQDAIQEAIKDDAKAELNGNAAAYAATSELKWQAITNAIDKLSKATNPGELSVIVSDLELVVAPTPTPTPAPTPKEEYETLTNGMMDNVKVKQMQYQLINLGFLSGTADGDFGNGTENAVKAFQRAAGLTVDGIASPEMQEVLYSDNAPRANSSTATSAPSNPSSQG